MGKYAEDHASALADVREAGTAIAFTLDSPGAQTATTGLYANPTTTTVSGYAIEHGGDPKEYERLGLIQSEAPRLLFAPDTYGEEPPLSASCTWGGGTCIARSVKRIGPDGTAIMSYVIVSRS